MKVMMICPYCAEKLEMVCNDNNTIKCVNCGRKLLRHDIIRTDRTKANMPKRAVGKKEIIPKHKQNGSSNDKDRFFKQRKNKQTSFFS